MEPNGPFCASGLGRRGFLRLSAAGLAGLAFSQAPDGFHTVRAKEPETLSTAHRCVFIFAAGGMSHLDTFDIKEGPWTPPAFDVVSTQGFRFPRGLFPKLAVPEIARHLAIVRSISGWTETHGVGEYWTFTNQEFNPSFLKERPHVGAVVALEYASRRRAGDVLPGFVALNGTVASGPAYKRVDQGFLPAHTAPFYVTADPAGLPAAGPSEEPEQPRFHESMPMRPSTSDGRPVSPLPDSARSHPVLANAFKFSAEERERYGNTKFGNACLVARNLAKADAGTAFVFISGIGWDHHGDIYGEKGLPYVGRVFDTGLARLITDLAGVPGRQRGKTALDETLIVVMGEFGRTPPSVYRTRYGLPLNQLGGRDHYMPAMSALLVGGGVKGGRIVGATDADGTRITDRGWSGAGPTRPEDIHATIYSALGIDWTKTIADTPSGRLYRYTPLGNFSPMRELFR